MSNSPPIQLRFDPSAGFTIRADFEGGGLSSDVGPLLLVLRFAIRTNFNNLCLKQSL